MGEIGELAALLQRIDGQGYGSYRQAKGSWDGPGFTLSIDHVQGDPFATPSKLRLVLRPETHGIPDSAWATESRRIGLCDYLLRVFASACGRIPRASGSGKSGQVSVTVDSPMVLDYGQARTIGALIREIQRSCDGRRTLGELVRLAVDRARSDGLFAIEASPELALPRSQELAKAVNRLRSLRVKMEQE